MDWLSDKKSKFKISKRKSYSASQSLSLHCSRVDISIACSFVLQISDCCCYRGSVGQTPGPVGPAANPRRIIRQRKLWIRSAMFAAALALWSVVPTHKRSAAEEALGQTREIKFEASTCSAHIL